MTLEESVLESLAEWKPPSDGRHVHALGYEPAKVALQLTADRQDSLSCSVWELILKCRANSIVNLQAWAERIAAQVTGLLEPLSVVEVDTTSNKALLRSQEPAKRKDSWFYYEIQLQGTHEAELRRYQAATTSTKREQVAFTLTHEVLAHFVADLAGV